LYFRSCFWEASLLDEVFPWRILHDQYLLVLEIGPSLWDFICIRERYSTCLCGAHLGASQNLCTTRMRLIWLRVSFLRISNTSYGVCTMQAKRRFGRQSSLGTWSHGVLSHHLSPTRRIWYVFCPNPVAFYSFQWFPFLKWIMYSFIVYLVRLVQWLSRYWHAYLKSWVLQDFRFLRSSPSLVFSPFLRSPRICIIWISDVKVLN